MGWLFALADKPLAEALKAMHENPGFPWTVQALAKRAGMSRTSFALRFKATVGSSPLEYLTRWRMTVAGDRLVRSDIWIKAPAETSLDPAQLFGGFAYGTILSRTQIPASFAAQGKVIDLDLTATDRAAAETEVRAMCERLLANTVIEKYTVEIA